MLKQHIDILCFSTVARVASFLCLLVTILPKPARATGSLELTWGVPTDKAIAGYAVYYGTVRGVYSHRFTVGRFKNGTIPGLTEGVTYFFVIRTTDAAGRESLPSNEMSYTVPGVALTIDRVQHAPGAAHLCQVASAGVVPFPWIVEESSDLKTWKTVMVGANSRVNFAFDVSEAPQMYFRLKQGIVEIRSALAKLALRQIPSKKGFLELTSTEIVPFAWCIDVTTDFKTWRTCEIGSNSIVDVAVATDQSACEFFRLRSQ